MTSGHSSPPWRIGNAEALRDWAEEGAALADAAEVRKRLDVLEFVRDYVSTDPDFGDPIDVHTRRARDPSSGALIVWTFDPALHTVEIIAPPCG